MSLIVVLIVSAVLYEAISLNKKVVVYKRLNYGRQYYSQHLSNLYFADSAEEVIEVISFNTKKSRHNYYKKLVKPLSSKILSVN